MTTVEPSLTFSAFAEVESPRRWGGLFGRLVVTPPVWSNYELNRCRALPVEPKAIPLRVANRTFERLREPMQRLEHLTQLEPNWDSYGGRAIEPLAIYRAIEVLVAVLDSNANTPAIVPTSEGGVQLEWHPPAADLEITIHSDGTVGAYLETEGGQTWEGALADSKWQIEDFLRFVARRVAESL
jgi:hypothetical protein